MEAIEFAEWLLNNYSVCLVSAPEGDSRREYYKWTTTQISGPTFTTKELYEKWISQKQEKK